MIVSGATLGINTVRQFVTAEDQRRFNNQRAGNSPVKGVEGYTSVPYIRTRGILAHSNNLNNILFFQFNPSSINDTKSNNYETLDLPGFAGELDIWAKGGAHIMSFELFFDATAGSNTPLFGKSVDWGNPTYDTLERDKPRGTLDDIEMLRSFQYPIQIDPNTPRFIAGGVVPAKRFMPPPVGIFVFGEWYLECLVTVGDIEHLLFNDRLIPTRSRVSVSLKILENSLVNQNTRLKYIFYKNSVETSVLV